MAAAKPRPRDYLICYTLAMPKLVKRYARSRLYDTEAACYVTVADLQRWRARRVAFTVLDVETGQDITQVLLA
jgi:polyhydroxyalkanoate synthesis regulator protein